MTTPMFCEKKHKKVRFEEKRPDGECGGALEPAQSESGKVYGYVCRTCGASKKVCEHCEGLFVNLDRHMFDKDGNPRDCYANSPIYRTDRALKDFGKGAP